MKINLNSLARIYFCTGARNHELLSIFEKDKIEFEFDERMASFKALGFCKGSSAPVAICTTSGTAVSECLSAMLEAQYSKLPLILITGDRPKKQHGTGAPQTIDHELLTRGAIGSYHEVELKDLKNLEILDPIYPLHINVLVDDTSAHELKVVQHPDISALRDFLHSHPKPLFLFSHEEESMRDFVEVFAQLNLPFYAETMSGAHDLSPIKTEKQLLELFAQGIFDSVIRVGFTPLSKLWRLLEKNMHPVASFDSRGLPALSYGEVYSLGSRELLDCPEWWEGMKTLSSALPADHSLTQLGKLVEKYPQAEISVFTHLQQALPANGLIYLGNSLIIRHFELTQTKLFRVHGNRGVNGIDGQLATAIGLASAIEETVYCILGDITTLYDLSSLREMPANLQLIIVNNKGGRIFDMLKLDKRIVLEHEFDFADLCAGLRLSYAQNDLSKLGLVQVLELHPSRQESEHFLKEWAK